MKLNDARLEAISMYHLTLFSLLGAARYVKDEYRAAGPDATPFLEAAERLEILLDRGLAMPEPEKAGGPLEYHLLGVNPGRDAADVIGYNELPDEMRWKFLLEVLLAALHKQRVFCGDLEGLSKALVEKHQPTFKWGQEPRPQWQGWITPAAKSRVEEHLLAAGLRGYWVLELEEVFFNLLHPVSGAILFLYFDKAGLVWKGEGDEQVLDVRGE